MKLYKDQFVIIQRSKQELWDWDRDEGSYQLSHIYNLFAAKPNSERRLDRPFWSDEGSSRSQNLNNNQ